jgi:hypothetical protein
MVGPAEMKSLILIVLLCAVHHHRMHGAYLCRHVPAGFWCQP